PASPDVSFRVKAQDSGLSHVAGMSRLPALTVSGHWMSAPSGTPLPGAPGSAKRAGRVPAPGGAVPDVPGGGIWTRSVCPAAAVPLNVPVNVLTSRAVVPVPCSGVGFAMLTVVPSSVHVVLATRSSVVTTHSSFPRHPLPLPLDPHVNELPSNSSVSARSVKLNATLFGTPAVVSTMVPVTPASPEVSFRVKAQDCGLSHVAGMSRLPAHTISGHWVSAPSGTQLTCGTQLPDAPG